MKIIKYFLQFLFIIILFLLFKILGLNISSALGGKYTKGRSWKIIYSKKFNSKSEAIKNEYKLKKNYLLRKKIKNKAL